MTYWRGGETWHIIQAMKATGNELGVIERWKADVATWANLNRTNPNAAAVLAWLPLWRPRPFYTVDELAPLWPALSIVTGFTAHWPNVVKSAKRLENELDFHLLPRLPEPWEKLFICERIAYWRGAPIRKIEQELENAQR